MATTKGGGLGRSRPRVVYWTNIPTPYTVARFNAIAQRNNLDFTAWFNASTESDRGWIVDPTDWQFPYRYVPSLSFRERGFRVSPTLVDRHLPDLVISLYAEPVFLFGSLLARYRGVRTAVWAEVTFDEWIRRRPWKEWIKGRFFPRVDGFLTCGSQGRRYLASYGAAADRMHHIVQGIDIRHYREGTETYPRGGDAWTSLRRTLGLSGTVFLYAGRLVREKGIEVLIEALVIAQQHARTPITLLLVGDGDLAHECRRQFDRLGGLNLRMTGFVQYPDMPTYFAAADVFVFPTLGDPYGLVINEAMASGLPVISTTSAGEVRDRIVDGRTGYLVPPGDARAFAGRITQLADDEKLRRRLGLEARELGNLMTLEAYASSVEHAVEAVLASPLAHPGIVGDSADRVQ